jgi:alkanesulfonate monooxygenase SsuD/methylene tetrahydromethanopterin reductase-like flavin-dependent oxidoreductase (luciferase family)
MKFGMFASPGSDPNRPLADVVDWYTRVVQKADELGYSEFWMASHTTSRWARVASPRQFIARAFAVTKNIRMGPAVEVLYQQHPITLAAQIGELDQVSRGRLLLGVGAGGPVSDLESYALPGANLGEKNRVAHEMMLESIEIMLNCWKEDGPDDYHGRFWNMKRPDSLNNPEEYAFHLRPFDGMRGRIAVAGFSARSHALTVAGERGYIPLSWSVSEEFAREQWECVSAGAATTGQSVDRDRWRQVQVIYVAETDREARKAIAEGFAATFWDRYWLPIFTKTGVMPYLQRRLSMDDRIPTPRDLIDRGVWIVGTPDRVASLLAEQNERFGGFGTILQVGFDYDGAAAEGWMRSMELLAKEVMPKVGTADARTPRQQ